MPVMNAPPRMGIPLRPDPSALRRAGISALMRAATAQALACERHDKARENPVRIAERMWPGDRDTALLTKGAVSPTTMGNASALAHLTTHFIASLAPVSAAAILLERTLQLSFDGAGTISVPGFIADASGASFVGEGAPIPVRSLLASPLLLDPSKLATISALSNEVIAGSAGNAQKMVEDVLTRSVGLALDAAMFDANPAVSEVRPAGLRNGVAASTASALTNPADAMVADIKTLVAIVAPVAGTEPIVLIASPARAKTMPLHLVALEDSFIVLPSNAIAAGDLLAIAPSALVSVVDGVPEISVSRETVLHMSDAPTNIGMTGTPPTMAVPTQSLFQSDVLALRCRMFATWAKRDPRAVAWLTTTNW